MNRIKFLTLISILCLVIIIPTSFATDAESAIAGDVAIENMTLSSSDDSQILSQDYYFDANAENDSGNGSISNPYKDFKSNRIVPDSNLYLANGEYTLDTSATINNVTIIGENPSQTILRYYGTGFTVSSSLTLHNITLVNLRIVNNGEVQATNTIFKDSKSTNLNGGVIDSEKKESIINLNNCTFNNTSAKNGGAIYIKQGTLTITDSLFTNNHANENGGTIAAYDGAKIHITDSKLLNEYSLNEGGGAIYLFDAELNANNLEITNCSANYGGAIVSLKSKMDLNGFTGRNNKAKYDGGAIYAIYEKLWMENSLLENNTAENAGAIYVYSVDDFLIQNTNFTKNHADGHAGAFHSIFLSDPYYPSILDPQIANLFLNNTAKYENDVLEEDIPRLFIGSGDCQFILANISDVSSIPGRYDLRELGQVSSVKDQGSNGNCWAFSTLGALESDILKATGIEFDLSEENMKNLMALYSVYGWNIEPNMGGYDKMGYSYLTSWLGPVNETEDPYRLNTLISPVLNSLLHVQNILFFKRENYTDNDEIKLAIMKYGGVSTSLSLAQTKYLNKGKFYYCYEDATVDHVGVIVGWDDNISRTNFKNTPPGDGAWIVENTWGSSWGENGFYYVSYYDTKFAQVGRYGSYVFVFNDTLKYDKNYQYDVPGVTDMLFLNESDVVWFKNRFNATDNEYLAAVSTYFEENTEWNLSIYVNNKLKLTQSGFETAKSYKTVELNQLIKLNKGDAFDVVFKIKTEGVVVGIPISEYLPNNRSGTQLYINTKFYTDGMSYISYDGENWQDLYNLTGSYSTHVYYSQVACIKAFTVLNRVSTSLELNVVKKGLNAQFTANVKNQYGALVKSGTVTFTVEGKNTIVNVKNGIASLSYPLENVSGIPVTAKFTATGFVASSATAQIDHVLTKLTCSNVTAAYNSGKNIVAALSDINGNPIKGVEVKISVAGITKTLTTYSNGRVALSVNGITPGNYIATITFDGNDYYDASNTTANVVINKANTVISAHDVSAAYKNTTGAVLATLTNAYGKALGVNVNVNLNGVDYTVKTNSNGQVIVSTSGLAPGSYAATISYAGNVNYNPSSAVANVVVTKADTVISASNVSVAYKDADGRVVATLTNAYGSGLGVNVNVVLNGQSYTVKADSKGKVSVPTNGLAPGSYVATFSYGGNLNYNPSNATSNVVVTKADTVISAPDVSVAYKDADGRVVATLTNAYGSGLGVNVNVVLNGQSYTVKADSKGKVSVPTDVLYPGSYVATFSYGGNLNYNPSNATSNVVVTKADTVISASNVSVAYKDSNGKVVATLTNAYGKPLNVNVNVVLNGQSYTVKANSKGNVIVSTDALAPGSYVATFSYGGNVNYNPSSTTANVVVNKANTVISAQNVSVAYKDADGKVVATLTNAYGKPLSVNVNVNLNGQSYTVKADSNGHVIVSTSGLAPGSYIATVTYNGNVNYNPSSATANITVNKANTNIAASDVTVAYKDSNGKLVATLTNAYGKPLSVNVNVNLNGQSYTVKANSNGQIIIPTSDLAPGSYIATITYNGNVNYNPSNATANIVVNKANTNIAASDVTVNRGDESGKLVATLTNAYGSGLGVNVNVNIDGQSYTVKADSKGKVIIPTASLASGSHVATITYNGNVNYNPSNATAIITVRP